MQPVSGRIQSGRQPRLDVWSYPCTSKSLNIKKLICFPHLRRTPVPGRNAPPQAGCRPRSGGASMFSQAPACCCDAMAPDRRFSFTIAPEKAREPEVARAAPALAAYSTPPEDAALPRHPPSLSRISAGKAPSGPRRSGVLRILAYAFSSRQRSAGRGLRRLGR